MLPQNPYLRAILGGLVAALTVAAPIIDDGLTPSEVVAIALALIAGTGLTAVPTPAPAPAKHRAEE